MPGKIYVPRPNLLPRRRGGWVNPPPTGNPSPTGPPVIGYPKLAQYTRVEFDGRPFTTNDNVPFQPLDYAKIQRLAINDYISPDTPGQDEEGDAVREIYRAVKEYNPNCKILTDMDAGQPFTCGLGWYGQYTTPCPPAGHAGEPWEMRDGVCTPSGCSTTNFAWARWLAIGRQNGIVYRQEPPANTNFGWLTDPNLLMTDFSQPAVATALADLCAQWKNYDPQSDGVFIDETGFGTGVGDVSWMQNGSQHVDYARRGFPSFAAWQNAFNLGTEVFFSRLRTLLGNDAIIVGNGGHYLYSNGGVHENFPFQSSSIAEYLTECPQFRTPNLMHLTAWKEHGVDDVLTVSDYARARYILGVGTLHEGLGIFTGRELDISRGWVNYWMDEFSVINGTATAPWDTSGKHWLGQRTQAATQDGVTGCYYSTFEHGMVVVNDTGGVKLFTIPGSGFRRIKGTQLGNNGVPVTSLSMANGTSVFLWKF